MKDLDSERWQLRAWVGGEPSDEARLALRREKDPVRRGRLLMLAGDPEAACSALEGAAGALPLAWKGAALLAAGRVPDARAALEASCSQDGARVWTWLDLAAACHHMGDAAGARTALAKARAVGRRHAAPWALEAVLAAEAGDREGAERWLSQALERRKQGWVYALRAAMRSRWDDLPGARADAEEAVRLDDSPWARLERGRVARRMGEFWVTLEDLEAVARRLPQDPEPLLLAAGVHLDQAQYAPAVEKLTKALALRPGDAEILRRRARVSFVRGDRAGALRDLLAARKLAPGSASLREDLAQALIVTGRAGEARRVLAQPGLMPGAREFWLGYLACRGRRFAEAERLFRRSARLFGPVEDRAEEADFYAWAARALREVGREPGQPKRELSLNGMGYRQLRQISLGALRSIGSADAIYCNHSDPKVADFLGVFPVPYTAIVFRGTRQQALTASATALAGLPRRRRVAMVTRAQPIVYGLLAWFLYKGAKERGVACRVPSSVSIYEILGALDDSPLGAGRGMQVRDAGCLEGVDPRFALTVYLPNNDRVPRDVARPLRALYPPQHRCALLPGAGDKEFSPVWVPLSGLAAALEKADPAVTLYVPARVAQRVPARARRGDRGSTSKSTAFAFSMGVDERVEVLSAVHLLARKRRPALPGFAANGLGYAEELKRATAGLDRHPAVGLYLRAVELGLDAPRAVTAALHARAPGVPGLDLETHPFTRYDELPGLKEALPPLWEELADLARQADLPSFFEERRPAFAAWAESARAGLDLSALAKAWSGYTGLPLRAQYALALSPLLEGGPVHHVCGRDRVFAVVGPSAVVAGAPVFAPAPAWKFWHEAGRTALDPLLERFAAQLRDTEGLWAPVSKKCDGVSSWRHCVAEHISQGVAARLWRLQGTGPAPRLRGLPYREAVEEALGRYEKGRARYGSLAAFYPSLLGALRRLSPGGR